MKFRIKKAGQKIVTKAVEPKVKKAEEVIPHLGKPVLATLEDGSRIPAIIKGFNDREESFIANVAVPSAPEHLYQTQEEIKFKSLNPLMELEGFDFTTPRIVEEFNDSQQFKLASEEGAKRYAVSDDEDKIVDYMDVQIVGYASTFQNITPADRDGDYVVKGAFSDTIRAFKKNPVMLTNHLQRVENIAGSYTELMEDDIGLRIIGKMSNAPELRRERFLVAEGHLKTLSIGGMFMFNEDGRGIERVSLFEISLVAVPANPDAIIQSRSISVETSEKMMKRYAPKLFTK